MIDSVLERPTHPHKDRCRKEEKKRKKRKKKKERKRKRDELRSDEAKIITMTKEEC